MHIAPAGRKQYEFFECTTETDIEEIKRQVEELGTQTGMWSLPAAKQELWFMNEECKDGKKLKEYCICEDWIVQARWRRAGQAGWLLLAQCRRPRTSWPVTLRHNVPNFAQLWDSQQAFACIRGVWW